MAKDKKGTGKKKGAGKKSAGAGRGAKKPASKRRASKAKREVLTAKNADKHILYQRAVQDPPQDIRFIDRVYKRARGQKPRVLREDFCGTALMCADWVRKQPERVAYGIDLHQPTLEWGRKHNIAPLEADGERVHLLAQNVLDPAPFRADVAVAFNFSYCIFKERQTLLQYFKAVREGLESDGAFFLDIHGGVETSVEVAEETDYGDFTYVWDQQPFDAVNDFGFRYIHFTFPDGSELHKAFEYDWRMWHLPELRDVLYDAGFRTVEVYWEGADEKGEGNGVFRKVTKAEQEDSWIAYVVAWR